MTGIDVGDFDADIRVRFIPCVGRHDTDLGQAALVENESVQVQIRIDKAPYQPRASDIAKENEREFRKNQTDETGWNEDSE